MSGASATSTRTPSPGAGVVGGAPADVARVVGALGVIFLTDPTRESLQELAECAETPLEGTWGALLGDLAHAARDVDLAAARVEYTRLFHGPLGAPCPPWECVARDQTPSLMGPRHDDALAFFRHAGVEPVRADSESADHIGLELAFVAMLASRIASGEDARLELERFWHEHVATWMPDFANRLIAETRLELFAAAGRLLHAVTNDSCAAAGYGVR